MRSPQEAPGQLPGTSCRHPHARVLRSACSLCANVSLLTLSASVCFWFFVFAFVFLSLLSSLSLSVCLSISLCLSSPAPWEATPVGPASSALRPGPVVLSRRGGLSQPASRV